MKKTQAFIEAKNERTVIVAPAEEPLNMYYVVKIKQWGGAYTGHEVSIHLTLAEADQSAKRFLENGQ